MVSPSRFQNCRSIYIDYAIMGNRHPLSAGEIKSLDPLKQAIYKEKVPWHYFNDPNNLLTCKLKQLWIVSIKINPKKITRI
jgi:hypothetical protein